MAHRSPLSLLVTVVCIGIAATVYSWTDHLGGAYAALIGTVPHTIEFGAMLYVAFVALAVTLTIVIGMCAVLSWVGSLFVIKQYRNRGIGVRLMREIESIALTMGHHSLFLFTHTAKNYYEKRGWNTIDVIVPPDVPHRSVVMSKVMHSPNVPTGRVLRQLTE